MGRFAKGARIAEPMGDDMIDRRRMTLAAVSLLAVAPAAPALAAKAPTEWDGLVRVKSKRLEYVYLLPGADFREYRRVMFDPTELAFKKNWLRDYNSTSLGLSGRISERELQEVMAGASKAADEILAEAYKEGGYQVVTEVGADVLRLRMAVVNIAVTAPEVNMAGRNRSFAGEAGFATLIVEARDSLSGAILGRAVDGKVAGDNSMLLRNRVTNRSDFRAVMRRWASGSVKGLNELKAASPINDQGLRQG
jgi:hypothetical protein